MNSPELGRTSGELVIAKVAVDLAEQNLERAEGLAEARVSAGQALVAARGALATAEAEFEALEETLLGIGLSRSQIRALRPGRHAYSSLEIHAPIQGEVLERYVSVGEGVEPTDVLFEVADISRVWVRADILEHDLASVRIGQRATIRTSAFERVFEGAVTHVAPVMDETTRTVRARIEVDNTEQLLRPGMFASVEIAVSGEAALVRAVPDEAVVRRGGEAFVFVEEASGTFHRVEVSLGTPIGSHQIIEAGVDEGERVVVEGAFFLESEVEKAGFEAGHAH